ncbi:MAG: alcohol dehydrogenase, partial [Myxococcaceae bacterium]|nr:alcohol dehydrogenase [Myxococcaceae bacterium]
MNAVVLRELGGPANLQLQRMPEPRPARGEVLLRVRACGVCHHDLIARRGDLGPLPL